MSAKDENTQPIPQVNMLTTDGQLKPLTPELLRVSHLLTDVCEEATEIVDFPVMLTSQDYDEILALIGLVTEDAVKNMKADSFAQITDRRSTELTKAVNYLDWELGRKFMVKLIAKRIADKSPSDIHRMYGAPAIES